MYKVVPLLAFGAVGKGEVLDFENLLKEKEILIEILGVLILEKDMLLH